jgi:translation elongation factor EF-1beta
MTKKAIITVSLVPEASEVSNSQLREDIKRTLRCDWLAEIEGVKVKNEA